MSTAFAISVGVVDVVVLVVAFVLVCVSFFHISGGDRSLPAIDRAVMGALPGLLVPARAGRFR